MFRRQFRTPLAYALLAFAAPGLAAAAAPVAESQNATANGPRTVTGRPLPIVRNASVRLNPVPGRPSAGYLIIIGGEKDDRLLGATAPGTRIEIHSSSSAGGVMKMAKLDSVAVEAGMGVHFDPGANHLMIFGLTGNPKTLPITFNFASGAKVTTTAIVTTAGADHAGH